MFLAFRCGAKVYVVKVIRLIEVKEIAYLNPILCEGGGGLKPLANVFLSVA